MVGVSAEACSESGFRFCVPIEVLGDGIVIECWHRRVRDRDKFAGEGRRGSAGLLSS